MTMNRDMREAVQAHIEVPTHIRAGIGACLYDLMHGPSFSLIRGGDVTRFTADDCATFYADLQEEAGEGDVIEETYTGKIGVAVREFIDTLPSQLWFEDWSGCILTSEPEGEQGEDGEWIEPEPCFALGQREIIGALFGEVFAREFA